MNSNLKPVSSRKLRNKVRSILADCKSELPTRLHAEIEEASKAFFEYRHDVQTQQKRFAEREQKLSAEIGQLTADLRQLREGKRCLEQELKCAEKRRCEAERATKSVSEARVREVANSATKAAVFLYEAIGEPDLGPRINVELAWIPSEEAICRFDEVEGTREAVGRFLRAKVNEMIEDNVGVITALCDDLLIILVVTSPDTVSVMIDTLHGLTSKGFSK